MFSASLLTPLYVFRNMYWLVFVLTIRHCVLIMRWLARLGARLNRRFSGRPHPEDIVFNGQTGKIGATLESPPVVVFRGMLISSMADTHYDQLFPWSKCFDLQRDRVLVAPVSCIASAHDRACEAFAFLTGTRTDYGEEHANEHGHDRFGPAYMTPAFPDWSPMHPIIVFGHSAGGLAAMEFQHMVATGRFSVNGVPTDARWIKAVLTMQSPHKGTTGVEWVRARYSKDGVVMPSLSLAHALSIICLLYTKFAPRWLADIYEIECPFSEAFRKDASFIDCFKNKDMWIGQRDTVLWDLNPKRVSAPLHPDIHYLSFVSNCTTFNADQGHAKPASTMFFVFRSVSRFIGKYKFDFSHPWFEYGRGDVDGYYTGDTGYAVPSPDWHKNDGVVPIYSQIGPSGCKIVELDVGRSRPDDVVPGVFNVVRMDGDHMRFQFCETRQHFFSMFYSLMFQYARKLGELSMDNGLSAAGCTPS